MRDPPWRTLVRELVDAGHESPYLDRLRARLDVSQAQRSLEVEIVGEIAAALGRAEERLLVALVELELADRRLAEAREPDERRPRATVFNAARDVALRRRWELVIHREAIGLCRNEIVERLYPIPPRACVDA